MIIRRALQKDINPILGLCGKFSTSPYTFDRNFRLLSGDGGVPAPAFAENMIRGPNAVTLVADENESVIGFITAAQNRVISEAAGRSVGSILLMAVTEEYRDRGVAKKLVQSALKLLFHSGVRLVTVITDLYNYPAVRVYESFGFRYALAWHIYRYYNNPAGQDQKKSLLKNIGDMDMSSLDGFCAHFNRPISLLKERSLDTERIREHFIRNLKNSIVKNRTAAFQYYHKNKPAGLINVMEDAIAAKAARTNKTIYKIMDLIVPGRADHPEIEKKMLQDILCRMDNFGMMEIWVDAENAETIQSAERANFHLSYTGVAYHLSR